jgi:hypothetical protein
MFVEHEAYVHYNLELVSSSHSCQICESTVWFYGFMILIY